MSKKAKKPSLTPKEKFDENFNKHVNQLQYKVEQDLKTELSNIASDAAVMVVDWGIDHLKRMFS